MDGCKDGYYPVEIASIIFHSSDDWQGEVQKLYQALDTNWHINIRSRCGLHVHVAPAKNMKFTLDQTKGVAKAVHVFEAALRDYMPRERKDPRYATPNHRCAPESVQQLYNYIESSTWAEIFAGIDQCQDYRKIHEEMGGNKDCSMFFGSRHGTIKFRRPPSAVNARHLIHWVALGVGFISAGSHQYAEDWRLHPTHATIRDLKVFIEWGLLPLGASFANALRTDEWRKH
ncbi:hypothetical protein GGS20DRAFT_539859 [Poronia punctata]|nr:hypothetical protein GGS20DRAFT_539859 [Poronia punctata]